MNWSQHHSTDHTVNVLFIQRNLMSSYDNKKNEATPSTSTCQTSDYRSNITHCDIHIGNFYCNVILTYLHGHIWIFITSFSNLILQSSYIYDAIMSVYADKNHTPSNTTQEDQFVIHDLSDCTDDDVNMTQENMDIGNYPLFILCF